MNKRSFRLVFNRRRSMRVAAAEHVHGAGKAASGGTRASRRAAQPAAALAAAGLGAVLLGTSPTLAAPPIPRAATFSSPGRPTLPVRSTDPTRTAGDWGRFTITTPDPSRLLITQQDNKAIINWDSFNVGLGNTVQFVQPDKGSTLNRIWDSDPSMILGRISANGDVILQNGNGLIFGPTARVETGRFVATALQISEQAYRAGFRGITDGSAAFVGDNSAGYVSIERGAEIRAAAGGDVLVLAPRVLNEGRIETPSGQTVLGAGQTVYLAASADPKQRGLIVGIKPFATDDTELNTVTQAKAKEYKTVGGETVADSTPDSTAGLVRRINEVVAEKGSINLVALAVRQNGTLRATTAVKGQNGVILLQGQQDVNPLAEQTVNGVFVSVPQVTKPGSVTLGAASVTEVLPSTDKTQTQTDSETFNRSKIRIEGQQILVKGGASVLAPSGSIEMLVSNQADQSIVFDPGTSNLSDHSTDPSRIVVESGATVSVAGLKDVLLPMSRNQGGGRLFQIELADSPVQRSGPLYREEIFFDARSPIKVANVSGLLSGVARSAQELSTAGGSLSLQSDGAVVVDKGAMLDLSGGSVRYDAGTLKVSLLRSGSNWIPISTADPNVKYDELGNSKARTDAGAAIVQAVQVPGYVEGKDAGSATIAGRRTYLGGDVEAGAIVGPYQDGRGSAAVPQAGELVIGRPQVNTASALASIQVSATNTTPRPDAFLAQPETASVEDLPTTTVVGADTLRAGGVGRLTLYAAGQVSLDRGTRLDLGIGGQLTLDAGSAVLDGQVRAASGSIAVTTRNAGAGAHDIALGAQAVLDISGTWVDDGRAAASASAGPAARISVDGGKIALNSSGSLAAQEGAVLDVSAGARRGAGSKLGKAGSIALAVNAGADVIQPLPGGFSAWQSDLRGFDFASGGSLSIAGLPQLTLGGTGEQDWRLNAGFFNDHGFGSIKLATLRDATIASAFDLSLQLRNYVLASAADATGRFATQQALVDPAKRAAVSLTVDASTAPLLSGSGDELLGGSSLAMESGSRISTGAGGTLTLQARRNLTVGGSLSAPGGTIGLSVLGQRGGNAPGGVFDDKIGFLADQALWLTSTAQLSVSGTEVSSVDAASRHFGKVLGGGTVNLNAGRGYVVAEAGSTIDLSGAQATLQTSGATTPQLVSRSAGTLNLSTPEGFVFDSTVQAQAPNAHADGGTLSVALTLGGLDRLSAGVAYSTAPRTVRIQGELAADGAGIQPGDDLKAALVNGSSSLSTQRIRDAGFGQASVKADDRIELVGKVDLTLPRSIVLDTAAIAAAPGAQAHIVAPYVSIGDRRTGERLSFELQPAGQSGDGRLEIDAATIDVFGNSSLSGWQSTSLRADLDDAGGHTRRDGDIRLIGTTRGLSNTAAGTLAFAGELALTAGQLYATTLSQFTIGGKAGDSLLQTLQPAGGSSSGTPLSALASLNLSADTIALDGVIRQPFGSITAQAGTLTLGAGSVTSVSAEGVTIPVGTTVNGRLWQYRPDGLYGADGTAKPVDASQNSDIRLLTQLPADKAISLNGTTLSVDPAARLSAAGSGDLQAWEFVAGVGGSKDYLARPGLYAVVPGYGNAFAPYDAEVANSATGKALQLGAYIDITMAGSGFAPGRYTLLPARYALLPGAFLVSTAADQGKSSLQQTIRADDGSTIVTGSFGAVGSAATSDTGTRILVEPSSTFLAKSRLDRTSINDFLADGATRLDTPVPALPTDAGRIAFHADQPFDWAALVDLGNPGKGKRGQLDIAVTGGSSAIVDDIANAPADLPEGTSLISAAAIAAARADSVLIGGLRSGSDGKTITTQNRRIDVRATQTAVESGEILLNASEQVRVADAAVLRSTGTADTTPRALALSGDSAFVAVSNRTDSGLSRSYAAGSTAGATGSATLGAGATLDGQAVRVATTSGLTLSQDAVLKTDNLGLSAGRLAIGTPTATTDATVLDGRVLEALQSVKTLELGSVRGIDVYGPQTFGVDKLVLDTPNLRGIGQADDVVRFSAARIELRNSTSGQADPAAQGSGRLVLQATPAGGGGRLTIGQSAQTGNGSIFLGFGNTQLQSSGDAVFSGKGQLSTQGDATLSAARITAASGAAHGLNAGGDLLLSREAGSHTIGGLVGQGASLAFSGRHIEQAGWVQAAGGNLAFTAAGSGDSWPALSFDAGSVTSAAGFAVQAAKDWTVYGSAGSIRAMASNGTVQLAGTLDVSARGDANAGALGVVANGTGGGVDLAETAALLGAGGSGQQRGRFELDTGQLMRAGVPTQRLDELALALDQGGFGGGVSVRLRQGDLRLDEATLRAQRVTLAADGGGIAIGGSIDARSAAGGVVQVSARDDVSLSGSIAAGSTRAGANGGDVLISAAQGTVRLADTARIDASGDDAADGRVVLRATRDDAAGTVNVAVAPGFHTARIVAGEVDFEAVRRFTGFATLGTGTSSGSKLGQASIRKANQDFADNAASWLSEAGLDGDTRFHLRAGVEIVAGGNFTVANDWNLWEDSRPGGEPGFLTIRAAGNLAINGSISDGFANAVRPTSTNLSAPTEIKAGDAWSFRLVAGADNQAADLLATVSDAAADLSVANTKLVRTTSGSIDMAAARDIVLATGPVATAQQAVVYVAGKPSTQNLGLELSGSSWTAQFTSHGGNLNLSAGRDAVGSPTTQQFGAWFYHTGSEGQTATAWWSGFDAFRQGVGSFGGGNVTVNAGQDVLNLGVVAPTSALASQPADGVNAVAPVVENGGDLVVRAVRDVAGGTFFLGRGDGLLQAGRDVTIGDTTNAATRPALAPVLGLMDGHWQVRAGNNASLAATYNPTMLPSANRTGRISLADAGLFFTYSPDSSLSVSSLAGGITYQADLPAVSGKPGTASYWSRLASSGPAGEQVQWSSKFQDPVSWLPPNLNLQALGGNLDMRLNGLTLFPSATGDIGLYAQGKITLRANSNNAALYMGDSNPANLPSASNPIPSDTGNIDQFTNTTFDAPVTAATVPFSTLHADDTTPVRIAAGQSIELVQATGQGRVLLVFPKRAELTAGQDVLNLNLVVQQFKPTDVTSVEAGGSFVEQSGATTNRIVVAGPGELRIEAGRQLDLGTSQGIETVGNQYNPALAATGASMTLAAGTRATLDADGLLKTYLMPDGSGTTVADRANAFADAYFKALGQDPANLSEASASTRATLVQRYTSYLKTVGAESATTVQARRDAVVRFVRDALGLAPLPDAELPTAFDTAWTQFQKLSATQQSGFAQQLLAKTFGDAYFAADQPYAALWQREAAAAGVNPSRYEGPAFERARREAMFAEINLVGGWASLVPAGSQATRDQVFGMAFQSIDLAGHGKSFGFAGDLDLVGSGVQTKAGGDITLLAPGGQINVGLPGTAVANPLGLKGAVVCGQGDLSALAQGDFQVNSQKVFVVGQGDITVWSSNGNIDAGRGANTAITVPPLVPTRQADGSIAFALPSTTVGSGIGILKPALGDAQGDIGLYAPNGEVLALDAQIRAPGRITLAADVVRGADNIVGSVVVGAPVVIPTVSISLPSAPTSAGQTQNAVSNASAGQRSETRERNSLLTVELLGLGGAEPADDCDDSKLGAEEKRKKRAKGEKCGP